jgi:hypothetical protein
VITRAYFLAFLKHAPSIHSDGRHYPLYLFSHASPLTQSTLATLQVPQLVI